MNFVPILLGFLLMNMMSNKTETNQTGGADDMGSRINNAFKNMNIDEIGQILQLVSLFNKMKQKDADMSQIISEVMSNPVAMEFLNKFAGGKTSDAQPTTENATKKEQTETASAQFGDNAESFDGKDNSVDDLFKPVENIAGVQLTEQLKKYYENWYVK